MVLMQGITLVWCINMAAKKKALTAKQSAKQIKDEMINAAEVEKSERMTKIVKKSKPITPLEDLKKNGKSYRGKKELIAFMEGKKLSAQALIYAKCYDCMGWYSDDGAVDCTCKDCALYPKMPYNKNKVKSKVVSAETIEKRKKTMESKV
jgi:hypothetical protein